MGRTRAGLTRRLPCRLQTPLTAGGQALSSAAMAFWGVQVKPGKVTPFVPPPEGSKLHLSQARVRSQPAQARAADAGGGLLRIQWMLHRATAVGGSGLGGASGTATGLAGAAGGRLRTPLVATCCSQHP